MVGRVVPLLDEFLRVMLQMIIQMPMQRPPTLQTLENVLKFYPMFIQGLWPRNSPLLQLPHITDQNIPFLMKVSFSFYRFFKISLILIDFLESSEKLSRSRKSGRTQTKIFVEHSR